MHAVLGAPREVLARGVDHGEVDRDLARRRRASALGLRRDLDLRAVHAELTEVDARVQRVDRGDELEPGRVEHGAAHRGAHAPAAPNTPTRIIRQLPAA